MFSVPRISKTIQNSSRKERSIFPGFIAQPEAKVVVDINQVPDLTLGPKRATLLKKLLERGSIKKSSLTFGELQQKKFNKDLLHTEVDCMDEAELRRRFPDHGVNHKFFSSSTYKYIFWLPSNSDNVVVAQIIWNGKIAMPR